MVYEKFNYFLLKYPSLLKNISLIIVDELQMIHDLENEAGFLNWLPAHHLFSLVRPVELRKGILREGTFAISPIIKGNMEKRNSNKKNKERVKDILKVISRRGIMLNLEEDKLKIN